MTNSLIEKITPLIAPVVQGQGLELFDVEYVKEGEAWFLRVYIDKEQGVDLDDCTRVSLALSSLLDDNDLIPQSYQLEVSSPGLERPLRNRQDYLKYQGQLISVETSQKIEGFTQFVGFLSGTDDLGVELTYEKNQITIPWTMINKARLAVEF